MSSNLIKAVMAYKSKRAEIKAQQRLELDTLTEPWAADVGDEIIKLRETEHRSIADIAAIIGIENRTFIYKMINAAKDRSGTTVREPEFKSVSDGYTVTDIPLYELHWFDNAAEVVFPEGESYTITVVDGVPDIPEEWAEHTKERRTLYRDIIASIKAHDWS